MSDREKEIVCIEGNGVMFLIREDYAISSGKLKTEFINCPCGARMSTLNKRRVILQLSGRAGFNMESMDTIIFTEDAQGIFRTTRKLEDEDVQMLRQKMAFDIADRESINLCEWKHRFIQKILHQMRDNDFVMNIYNYCRENEKQKF